MKQIFCLLIGFFISFFASAASVNNPELEIITDKADKSIHLSLSYDGLLKKKTKAKIFVRENDKIVYYLLVKNAEVAKPLVVKFNLKEETSIYEKDNKEKDFVLEVHLGKDNVITKTFSF